MKQREQTTKNNSVASAWVAAVLRPAEEEFLTHRRRRYQQCILSQPDQNQFLMEDGREKRARGWTEEEKGDAVTAGVWRIDKMVTVEEALLVSTLPSKRPLSFHFTGSHSHQRISVCVGECVCVCVWSKYKLKSMKKCWLTVCVCVRETQPSLCSNSCV